MNLDETFKQLENQVLIIKEFWREQGDGLINDKNNILLVSLMTLPG